MSIKFCVAESDTKNKTCPIIHDGQYGCVGSMCMAWRWVETHIADDAGNPTILSCDTHGYCGLAGAPWRPWRP